MYAKIENGGIVEWATEPPNHPETVANAEGAQVPNPAARPDYRPLVIQWPEFDKATHQVNDPTDAIEAARIVRTWVVIPRPSPTADDVRREAQRRMMALVGARDAADLSVKISNAVREQGRLQAIRSGVPGIAEPREWTPDEAKTARHLWGANVAIDAIRVASNVLEAKPPADYTNNKHWPAG